MIHLHWIELLLLLPLPVLIWYFAPAENLTGAAIKLPFYSDIGAAGDDQQYGWRRVRMGLLALVWLCLVIAAARPQIIGQAVNVPVSGRDLMMAVDVSGSMEREDMTFGSQSQTRLDAVKRVAGEFMDRRTGDRIGLILFGTAAYLQAPLSLDRKTVKEFLYESLIGIAGEKTAIGDAIGLAVKRLQSRESDDKVLVLLTDGSNTAGVMAPEKAAELAAVSGLKIHTVGIGATQMAVQGIFGSRLVNPSRDLDEAMLKTIAQTTGGEYFRATDAQALEQIYRYIDELEPVEEESNHLRPTQELFYWPLSAAILIGFLSMVWEMFRHRINPPSGQSD